MPERDSSPPLPIPTTRPWRRRAFRAVFLLVGLGFGGFYFLSLNASRNRLDVTLWNHTGGPMTEVSFGEPSAITPYYDRIENDAKVQVSVPLTDAPVISFRGPDHQSRTRDFAFHDVSGVSHRLEITLEKKIFYVSQLSTYQPFWPIGARITYRQPYNFGDPMTPYPPAQPNIPDSEPPPCL